MASYHVVVIRPCRRCRRRTAQLPNSVTGQPTYPTGTHRSRTYPPEKPIFYVSQKIRPAKKTRKTPL